MGFMHGYAVGGWMWLLPVLTFVLFWGGILYVGNRVTRTPPQNDTAMEILKKRYARGELSKEECEELRREI